MQDPEDEGLPGVTVTLKTGACPAATTTRRRPRRQRRLPLQRPGCGRLLRQRPRHGAGGVLHPTADRTARSPRSPSTWQRARSDLTVDYGYKPGGTGSIGDRSSMTWTTTALQRRRSGHPQRHRQAVRGHERQWPDRPGDASIDDDIHRCAAASTASPTWRPGWTTSSTSIRPIPTWRPTSPRTPTSSPPPTRRR